eukprot:300380_1
MTVKLLASLLTLLTAITICNAVSASMSSTNPFTHRREISSYNHGNTYGEAEARRIRSLFRGTSQPPSASMSSESSNKSSFSSFGIQRSSYDDGNTDGARVRSLFGRRTSSQLPPLMVPDAGLELPNRWAKSFILDFGFLEYNSSNIRDSPSPHSKSGNYATVNQAQLADGRLVAMKVFKLSKKTNQTQLINECNHEMQMLWYLENLNRLSFNGSLPVVRIVRNKSNCNQMWSERKGPLRITTEWIDGEDLRRGSEAVIVPMPATVRTDVARLQRMHDVVYNIWQSIHDGLLIHTSHVGVMHCDLHGGNLMKLQNGEMRVIDWGNARRLFRNVNRQYKNHSRILRQKNAKSKVIVFHEDGVRTMPMTIQRITAPSFSWLYSMRKWADALTLESVRDAIHHSDGYSLMVTLIRMFSLNCEQYNMFGVSYGEPHCNCMAALDVFTISGARNKARDYWQQRVDVLNGTMCTNENIDPEKYPFFGLVRLWIDTYQRDYISKLSRLDDNEFKMAPDIK